MKFLIKTNKTYNEIIEYKNIELAIIRYLENEENIPDKFRMFYSIMDEKYEENKDSIMEIIEKKQISMQRVSKIYKYL